MYSIQLNVTGRPSTIVANGFRTSLDAFNHLAYMYPEMKISLACKFYKIVKI